MVNNETDLTLRTWADYKIRYICRNLPRTVGSGDPAWPSRDRDLEVGRLLSTYVASIHFFSFFFLL